MVRLRVQMTRGKITVDLWVPVQVVLIILALLHLL